MIPLPPGDPWVASAPDNLPRPDATHPVLVVDPTSWWLTAGNRTQVAATWSGIPPGCAASPLWFRWTVAEGFAEGALGSTAGASVNFTAGSAESGTARVEARSTVLVTCGTNQEATYGTAVSTITVVAPLRIENVSLAPTAVAAGAPANLSALLVGGQPPYGLRVDWNDGNVSFYNVSAPGRFSFAHRFATGSFSPTVFVSDATGLVVNGTVDGPLSASSGLAVAVATRTVSAEVGVPVQFTGEILNPPVQYGSVTLCADSRPSGPSGTSANVSTVNFTCTFASAGSAEVDFEVIPIDDDLPPAEARWWEPVAPPLGLNVSPPGVMGEVGLPTVFPVRLSGGVPPFILSWRLVGNSTARQELVFADGFVLLPVWPSEPGTYGLTVTVQDALGALVAVGTVALPVDPPLNVSASAGRTLGSYGAVVQVAGTVSQGTAPYLWWVLPGETATNESAPNGTLGSVASFSWNGTLAREGNSTVTIVVVDGEGAVGWDTIVVSLVPELRASARASASLTATGPAFLLNLSIDGGLPPFDLEVNSSAAEEWNRSFSADGTYSVAFPTNDSGPVSLGMTLRDRLGVDWVGVLSVVVRSSTPPPNASSPPPPPVRPSPNATSDDYPSSAVSNVLVLLLIVVAGALAFAFWWRRWHRTNGEPVPSAEPIPVLRRILEPAEGADRATVELMAEEAGIPLDVVRATIDRLVSEGSIRSESGPEGEEVLAWSDPDRS
jgi:hypothetical protein